MNRRCFIKTSACTLPVLALPNMLPASGCESDEPFSILVGGHQVVWDKASNAFETAVAVIRYRHDDQPGEWHTVTLRPWRQSDGILWFEIEPGINIGVIVNADARAAMHNRGELFMTPNDVPGLTIDWLPSIG